MRFGPQNHAGGQGKEGVEEALGPGAQGWGNEPWWPWNVSGPCGRFLVPSLCQGRGRGARWGRRKWGFCCSLGSAGLRGPSAGCSHCPGQREGPGAPAPSQGWRQPLGIPTGGSMPGVPNQALALFSVVVLLCEMQGPGGMRRGEAEDAPTFLPHARDRRGSWNCSPGMVTALWEGGRAGSEQPPGPASPWPRLSSC